MDIKKKRQKFNALLHVGKMIDAKEHILGAYGVLSTLDLTEEQLDDAIRRVHDIIDIKKDNAEKHLREWRHKCLRMLAECGVNTQDWNAVNAFMMDKRIAGKHLYELNLIELAELHRKLHNVKVNIDKKQNEVERLQISN